MKRTDLTKFFGTRGRVSEVLNRQRNLTLAMIKKLHKEFGIPAETQASNIFLDRLKQIVLRNSLFK